MYKVGETVICIDDHNGAGDIELNKIYIVKPNVNNIYNTWYFS